jgi:hypothetical protein
VVFRDVFATEECARLAAEMKREAGITEGEHFTRVDAIRRFDSCRQVLFDERILGAVRQVIGCACRFLQVSDLHYRHDTANWHRDSVHRAVDASAAPDWRSDQGEYGVVKAIVYLESQNAAMGVIAGSQLSPIAVDLDRIRRIERQGGHVLVGPHDEPNRRFSAAERARPVVWLAGVGDLLVFDERMFHCGRRVDGTLVSRHNDAAKFTLSLVFGADNEHSQRLYSYFRYARRELHYGNLPPDLRRALAERDLVLSTGWGNYYEQHPDDIRLAFLRDPEKVDELVAQFSRARL